MSNNSNNLKEHYDVGLVGYWYATNYGSVITYYALSNALNDMGYSTLIIDCPEKEKDPEGEDVFSRKFFRTHGNVSPSVKWTELQKINEYCDNFIIGSDQVWTANATRHMRYMFYLPFADNTKRKIAYAPSFGHNSLDLTTEEFNNVATYLNTFHKISVREDVGIDLIKKQFGLHADHVLDPVFLMNIKEYNKLAKESDLNLSGNYLLAYLLDPTPDKELSIQNTANELGLQVKIILDGRKNTFNKNLSKLTIFSKDDVLTDVDACDWVKAFENANYVVTDSHHGLAMSVIYNKQFICYANHNRGYARFTSLLNLLNIKNRMIENSKNLTQTLLKNDIDYKQVNHIIEKEKNNSLKWLKSALSSKIVLKPIVNEIPKEVTDLHSNFDFIKIRILATLLRDYGIKHVVLSPGGRDVPLVRMFEHNEGIFTLHNVTDERSAAYYGLGLASQLKQPVACICTSGTAASNYLPAVTEAYYTGVPLIMITADRYGIYLNHGEDQTIPQKHIYHDVVKMEVSLPDSDGFMAEYQMRRDISNCILESTHNGYGPVHINIPIHNISIGSNVAKHHWSLLPFIYPHILRVGFNNGDKDMLRWVAELKKSQRILLVYGQNSMLSPEEQQHIEQFVSKYNCVVVTDSISNLNCQYSLNPYVMLNSINQDEFNKTLAPDILITVGGKRLMNDPLTFKIRGSKGVRHWSVYPGGTIKDFYFKLTSVIDSTQDQFFNWFAEKAGDIKNNQEYFNAWKNLCQKYSPRPISGFNSLFIQDNFFPAIPKNSFLHLGVGQSFFDVRRHDIDPSIEVYCNMGTNGIDGCTSTFMGQCSIINDKLCFLLVGDLSFFYDMNSIWNKKLNKNMRILLVNNNGSGLLRGHNLKAITSVHNTSAEGWVRSTGFEYMSAKTKDEFIEKLKYFTSNDSDKALFFEVFCD